MTASPQPGIAGTSLFTSEGAGALIERFCTLRHDSERQWGKLTLPGMLAHCRVAMETCTSGRKLKRSLPGYLLAWAVRGKMIDGPKPFPTNSPTDPRLILADPAELDVERDGLIAAIQRFHELGPAGTPDGPHPFFGKLTSEQWDRLMVKHLDHHLQQFGA